MGDESEVHDFLDAVGAQHRETGLAAGHDVGMVAEDVERACGKRTRRNVEHGGKQLARDFIHIGDHEQQTLGRGVSGGQRARGQRTVHGARSAAFGLHFRDAERLPEHVQLSLGCPFVGGFRHRRRRSDGIYRRYFGERVRDVRSGGISVDCHLFHLEYSSVF